MIPQLFFSFSAFFFLMKIFYTHRRRSSSALFLGQQALNELCVLGGCLLLQETCCV